MKRSIIPSCCSMQPYGASERRERASRAERGMGPPRASVSGSLRGEAPQMRMSATDALSDGVARVLAAPMILLGTIGLVILYGMPGDVRHLFGAWLLWAFLSGGILDRYARRRPTRGRGFFGA